MIELETFLQGQQAVYDKFKATAETIRQEGTVPPKTVENRDGYLIILRHSDEIIERCSDLSQKIAQVVPAMVYERIAVHTTISVVGMQYRLPEQQEMSHSSVGLLEDAISAVFRNFQAITIPYEGWLYNRDTTIAQGLAGKAFVDVANLIHQSLEKYLVAEKVGKVQLPWGGHITVSRFLEHTSPEQLAGFFHVVQNEPVLPPSTPEAVCLGYVSVKDGKVKIDIQEQFPLKK